MHGRGCRALLLLAVAALALTLIMPPVHAQQEEQPMATISLQLVDVEGRPLEGFFVEAHNASAPPGEEAFVMARESNETGWVDLPLALNQSFILKIFWRDMEIKQIGPIEVTKNETLPPVSCPVGNLKFIVVDEQGSPVPDAYILLNYSYVSRGTPLNRTEVLTLDEAGEAQLEGWPLVEYVVDGRRHGVSFQQFTIHPEGDTEIRITCPEATLTIRVVDYYGNPMGAVRVEAYEAETGKPMGTAGTDTQGLAQFVFLAGKYHIKAFSDRMLIDEMDVDLARDTQITIKQMLYTLTVKILDAWEKPVSGAQITLTQDGTQIAQTKTDSEGTASFKELAEGEYEVDVSVGGQSYATMRVYLDSTITKTVKVGGILMLYGHPVDVAMLTTATTVIATLLLITAVILLQRKASKT